MPPIPRCATLAGSPHPGANDRTAERVEQCNRLSLFSISRPGEPAHQIIHRAVERHHLAVVGLRNVDSGLLVQMLEDGEEVERIDVELPAHRPLIRSPPMRPTRAVIQSTSVPTCASRTLGRLFRKACAVARAR